MRTNRRAALILSAATTMTLLPGCLVTSAKSDTYTGNRVQPGAERQVVLRESTPDDAVELLGEPSERETDADGREVLTWRWTRHAKSAGAVFLVFGGSSETTETRALHIAFRDGVAERRWFD